MKIKFGSLINFVLIVFFSINVLAAVDQSPIKVGSKKFTENVILGEIITQLITSQNQKAEHIRELGGTRILLNALLSGEIDIYPEYTGTIIKEILANENVSEKNLRGKLADYNIGMIGPLGFNNTYAIGMKKKPAEKLRIEKISDLKEHPSLTFGFTNEFMDREDGWHGLQSTYDLPH